MSNKITFKKDTKEPLKKLWTLKTSRSNKNRPVLIKNETILSNYKKFSGEY